MSLYIDTSAFMALANADDPQHGRAVAAWTELVSRGDELITTNYVVHETIALLHSRHGTTAVSRFVEDLLGPVRVELVSEAVHEAALASVLAVPGKSGPSLTDCTGFELIRRERVGAVFAYDRHFVGQGFKLIGQ